MADPNYRPSCRDCMYYDRSSTNGATREARCTRADDTVAAERMDNRFIAVLTARCGVDARHFVPVESKL
jgi:hypothetical protein